MEWKKKKNPKHQQRATIQIDSLAEGKISSMQIAGKLPQLPSIRSNFESLSLSLSLSIPFHPYHRSLLIKRALSIASTSKRSCH